MLSNIQKAPAFLQFSFNSIGHLKLFHVPGLKFDTYTGRTSSKLDLLELFSIVVPMPIRASFLL